MIAGLLLSDVYMIVTGLVAGWTDDPALKWWFYAVNCLSFIAIYALLFGPFRKLSLSSPEGATYRKKAPVLAVVWLVYPSSSSSDRKVCACRAQWSMRYCSPAWT